MKAATILVAEDHPIFREAIAHMLAAVVPDHAVRGCATLAECLDQVRAARPSLVLLDLDIPGADGLTGLIDLMAAAPDLRVIILSATDDPGVVTRAMALAASGYVSKAHAAPVLAAAVRQVLAGSAWVSEVAAQPPAQDSLAPRLATLTPQQLRILRLVMTGLLNKQIAGELGITEQTVKEHVSTILRKLNVGTRVGAAMAARQFFSAGRT